MVWLTGKLDRFLASCYAQANALVSVCDGMSLCLVGLVEFFHGIEMHLFLGVERIVRVYSVQYLRSSHNLPFKDAFNYGFQICFFVFCNLITNAM